MQSAQYTWDENTLCVQDFGEGFSVYKLYLS